MSQARRPDHEHETDVDWTRLAEISDEDLAHDFVDGVMKKRNGDTPGDRSGTS